MKCLQLLLFITLISLPVTSRAGIYLFNSENDSIKETGRNKEKKSFDPALDTYDNSFKFSPLKLMNLSNPGVEFAYERRTGKKFSTQLMASCLLPYRLIGNQTMMNATDGGLRFSIEERFYYHTKMAPKGCYFALELDYMNKRYHEVESFMNPSEKEMYDYAFMAEGYFDSIVIRKQTTSVSFKFGIQKIIKHRFILDFYAGFGIRYKDTRHLNRMHPNDRMVPPRHPNFTYETNREGWYWTIHIPVNLRIGWILW